MIAATKNRNYSERLFEKYLDAAGIRFAFEPQVEETGKRPDFRIEDEASRVWCEVKELREKEPRQPARAAHIDPYKSLRKKIQEASKQFRTIRNEPCVLVLYNVDDWTFLDTTWVVFGAMLGDLGSSFALNLQRSGSHYLGDYFGARGKMVNPHDGSAQNTTISAIAILEEERSWMPVLENAYEKRCRGRELDPVEKWQIRAGLFEELGTTIERVPRVKVFRNPYARVPLRPGVFSGDYDAEFDYKLSLKQIVRTFAGAGLRCIEARDAGPDISNKLEAFRQAVVDNFHPQRIILFGSHAYGAPEPDSDIDLLVVLPGDGNAVSVAQAIRKRIPCEFALDLITRSDGEIRRRLAIGDPFMREIMDRGIVLYDAADR